MKADNEMLEGQLEAYEKELRGLNSYGKELKDRAAEHGTAGEHYEEDLTEAEHNIKYTKLRRRESGS